MRDIAEQYSILKDHVPFTDADLASLIHVWCEICSRICKCFGFLGFVSELKFNSR